MSKDKRNKELNKMWEEARKQLAKFSKDTLVLLKKGEEEVVKLSEKGKLNLENTLLNFKKEQISYSVGKHAIKLFKKKKSGNKEIDKLIGQLNSADKQIINNNKALKKL